MSWAVGFDNHWNRDVGYGVPSICDQPNCNKEINRGLGYVCGNDVYGGEIGCGLYFCEKHQVNIDQQCKRCEEGKEPFTPTLDTQEWRDWKRTHESWSRWRKENPNEVLAL